VDSIFAEVAKQGPWAIIAIVMFVVWVRSRKEEAALRKIHAAQQEAHIKRLEDITRDRKADRDALLTIFGRIEGTLARLDVTLSRSERS
jgi:hypothetical protein